MARTELIDRTRQRAVPVALLVVAALLSIARLAVWMTTPAVGPGAVRWVPLEKAVEESRATGKPIMFDFTAA